ncbi:DnaB-like helicase C-terminal domain-containing protein [Streptomyces incanus]|uniref:DnaB-like helicase C-terminal domain-containing protein n=1 Tax=Streptomyces incanus TaxID=887453 RepID=A0ABW0Y0K5_9ACTN
MSDLRDSGALEQDADAILLLHHEDYYAPESGRAGETDLIVAKHRNGPTATAMVAHQFHYNRLRDMSAAEEPACRFSNPVSSSPPQSHADVMSQVGGLPLPSEPRK